MSDLAPRACVTLALVALLLTGCGSARDVVRADSPGVPGATAPTSTAPTSAAPPSSPPTVPAKVDLPGIVGGITSFTSPTGNIGCYLGANGARCDVRERSYTPPPEPDTCGLAWGSSLEVGPDGAGFACVGDTVMGSDTILKYDNSTVVGGYGCVSRRDGVSCVHRASGHGFTLSRSVARTF